MNRRHFLSAITAAVGAFAIDPERALWVPGKKFISVPKPRVVRPVDMRIVGAYLLLGVVDAKRNVITQDMYEYAEARLAHCPTMSTEYLAVNLMPAFAAARGYGYFPLSNGNVVPRSPQVN